MAFTGKGHDRNSPCWCGSGKKYKKCHLGRGTAEPLAISAVHDTLRTSFENRSCLYVYPEGARCKKAAIRSHSIRRTGGLSSIAKDGHVLGTVLRWPSATTSGDWSRVQRIGINRAS